MVEKTKILVFGQGKISGYLSALLGICALSGVIAFKFPSYLTTKELLGQLYTVDFARHLLLIGLILSFSLGVISFILSRNKNLAVTGIVTSFAAILLGGASVEAGAISGKGPSLGLDWFILSLLTSMLIFIPLEKAFRKYPQPVLRLEWQTDLTYFFVGHLLVQFYLLSINMVYTGILGWAIYEPLQATIRGWPFAVQFLSAVLLADLAQYALHRLYHEAPFLWRFHSIHHSCRVLDWLAGSRMHLVEIFLTRTAVMVPLYLVGFSEPALNAYVILVGIQAVLVHSNVNWEFGILKYILVTPQYHHWHHADDPGYKYRNYAVHTPLIDMCFGTYKLPGNDWPENFGIVGNPVPAGFFQQLFYPFIRRS